MIPVLNCSFMSVEAYGGTQSGRKKGETVHQCSAGMPSVSLSFTIFFVCIVTFLSYSRFLFGFFCSEARLGLSGGELSVMPAFSLLLGAL